MNYLLLQLKFNTPVHFGSSDSALALYSSDERFLADTLFSALCHTALRMHGPAGIDRLVRLADEHRLLLSDSMPWQNDRFYLPKPYFQPRSAVELPSDKRKAVKKLKWIPADEFEHFERSIDSGDIYLGSPAVFGKAATIDKAAVPETGDAEPYQVGVYCFNENSGLYVIIGTENDGDMEWLTGLMDALGLSGIGGKTSAGYGKFSVIDSILLNEPFDEQTEWLYSALTSDSETKMLLTSSVPADDELDEVMENADYRLVRRAGFITSDSFAETNMKKQTQYFMVSGSVVKKSFSGKLYRVGVGGTHPVYRYSIPMLLGVRL